MSFHLPFSDDVLALILPPTACSVGLGCICAAAVGVAVNRAALWAGTPTYTTCNLTVVCV